MIQGYDFCHLYNEDQVCLQMGGSDQWGNITAGIEYTRKKLGKSVYGITWPLLTKSDGTKFGKSEFLDHDMLEADISKMVKKGKNYIKIEFDNSIQAFEGKTGIEPVSMMWDSVYIIGNFTLEKDENAQNKYIIAEEKDSIEAKSWSIQGYPYLSGAIQYEQEFNLNKEKLNNRVFYFDGGNNIKEYSFIVNY